MVDRKKTLPKILSLLDTRLGVDLTQYKEGTLQRRVARRIAALKLASFEAYLTLLRKDEIELQSLFSDLFIQVTEFFRDAHAFDLLKNKFLADRLAEKGRQTFRVWVPACSTGEEVYSIAIICSELLGVKRDVQLQIFGTDINEKNLEKARTGVYSDSIRKQISPQRLARYFDRLEQGVYRVKKGIREVCVFARHDVTADPPFSAMDLICCRNLLIYFQQSLQERLIPVFHYSLRNSGILFLGLSETVGRHSDLFELHDKRIKVFTRKEKSPGALALDKFRNPPASRFARAIAPNVPKFKKEHRLTEKSIHTLVSKAVQENIGAEDALNIVPLSIPQSSDKIYLVFLDSSGAKRHIESNGAKGQTKNASLRRELSKSRDSLRQMSERREAVSEELRAANEEVISSNEELQSTNEELETAKEELQSINEELGALNRELKSRNLDLEKSAAISSQFTAIVDSSHDAIISKNLESIVQTWNAGATEIFGYTAEEMVGKSITILIPEDHYD
ncbi:MAG TPA: CheR family methyltransferase, partial [Verrucomicrobiae bacterium]|nr:CheR family methyltransferase [Verrucomicrobiae bacterium]